MAGRPSENRSTHPAVLGPTPGSSRSQALASLRSISPRKPRSRRPHRALISPRMALIRAALMSASPPALMARAISPGSAAATASQDPNRSTSAAKARWELTSEVFWERTTAISSERGSCRGCQRRGPYSFRSSRRTCSTPADGRAGSRRAPSARTCPAPGGRTGRFAGESDTAHRKTRALQQGHRALLPSHRQDGTASDDPPGPRPADHRPLSGRREGSPLWPGPASPRGR